MKSLRLGHNSLLHTIEQLQQVARSYNQAKPILRGLHEQLLNYFARQDQKILDQLYSFYIDDRSSYKLVEFLEHDLKDIKIKLLIFYDKHTGEVADMNARSFPLDFQKFLQEIINRMNVEEEYLFPLLEKLPKEN
ncbi:MAG: hypothetical protein A2787_07000 [Omnitrophica WOR_2 bacterium RIFCSPHIGHO2_01_FULL_48_9]|nr:MAG: hypothetical protein A2787_07000 [Omnitrophica WOR_2 bacterium RIFCSPHIGHO2_01_FULL_48_9]